MRAVVQRVNHAKVTVESEVVGAIGLGLCVLVGVVQGDTASDAAHLAKKVAGLRIFPDHEDRMNRSVKDVGGQVLAISQFTLAGDARKGHRPSFIAALEPHQARVLFEEFCRELFQLSLDVQTGRFRAHMQVTLCNDGPVTLLLDSKRTF